MLWAISGGSALDRLSTEDARILKLEAGAVRGHTCKILVLEPAQGYPLPTLEALRTGIAARLDAAPRLRQRLLPTPLHLANPVWVDDPDFEIARHVRAVSTHGPVTRAELEQIVAWLMSERLNRSRPLWQLDVVEQLEDGAMALIWRVHHCMADGAATIRLGSAVLWSEDREQTDTISPRWTPHASPSRLDLLVGGLRDRARVSVRHRASQPARSLLSARAVITRELGRTAAPTELARRVGPARTVAFALAPLADCKHAGKAIDGAVTLNDVVLALVAGGVRTWLEQGLGPRAGIRVKVPVSLHHDGEDDRVVNRDSYFFVDLPVAEPDPVTRLLAINRETRERKLDHDADTLYRLGLHPFVARWAMSPHVFTFNVSNVRGPSTDVWVLGARVRELYSLGEIAQYHALRVAVISAAGKLSFGLNADRDAVKDLHVVADGIRRSTEDLLALAA